MNSCLQTMFALEGRIALCTGASSGIGAHMAKTLAKAGADVVLIGRDERGLKATQQAISSESPDSRCIYKTLDLSVPEHIEPALAQISGEAGFADILVNAAGINLRQAADDILVKDWQQTLNINTAAPFFLAKALIGGMQQKGYGNIINIASLQSYRAFKNSMAYGASKGAIVQLTRAMAEEWSGYGIVCNAIAPGFFPTGMTAPVYADKDMLAHHAGMTAIGRNGELSDLEGAALFFASDACRYVTGQVLAVDGGYTAK